MEEYRKIWERAPKIAGDDFVFSKEIWKKYYSTYKILNNTFRSVGGFHAFDDDDDGDDEDPAAKKPKSLKELCIEYKKKIKWKDRSQYTYLFAMQPDPLCPHTASLDDVQQEVYWYLRQKLSSNNGRAVVAQEENTIFSMLHQKVMEEQPVYCKFVENLWVAQRRRCLFINPEIKKFVDAVWKNRLPSVNNYPLKYCDFRMAPLVFAGDNKRLRALPAPNEITSLGIASRYIPPQLGRPLKIYTEHTEMQASYPAERFRSKVPVSRDKTAQEIACKCKPDIVISMSGLKCIMDNFNPDYDREWDIPIVVRDESPALELKISKRVVYIDKPLPPRTMTALDKNNWYNKYAVKALFCRLRNEGLHRSIVPLSPDRKEEDNKTSESFIGKQRDLGENDDASGNDDSLMESSDEDCSWASDSSTGKLVIACSDDENVTKRPPLLRRNRGKHPAKNYGVAENSSGDTQSESLSEVSVQKEIKTYSRQSKADLKQDGNKSDGSIKSPGTHENMDTAETTGEQCASVGATSENHNEPCLMSNVCVTYRLWKLNLEKDSQEETRANFLKGESSYKPITLLVRNKQEAVRIVNGEVCPVYLAAKQEYQAEYGLSMSSMSEICRLWASLYFRTNCTLVRARIDSVSHEVLLSEEKRIEEIAQEWYDPRIRCTLLSILYSVLLGLQDLEPGNYLLSHRKKMGSFVSLMKTTNRLSSIDLETLYENVNVDDPEPEKDYPWFPIDVSLQTPSQHSRRRVPGLFPINVNLSPRNKPPTFVAKKPIQQNPKQTKKKKKKKKPKKKKKTAAAVQPDVISLY